jgi:hypothetical protein
MPLLSKIPIEKPKTPNSHLRIGGYLGAKPDRFESSIVFEQQLTGLFGTIGFHFECLVKSFLCPASFALFLGRTQVSVIAIVAKLQVVAGYGFFMSCFHFYPLLS